jgi:hypothetical protein
MIASVSGLDAFRTNPRWRFSVRDPPTDIAKQIIVQCESPGLALFGLVVKQVESRAGKLLWRALFSGADPQGQLGEVQTRAHQASEFVGVYGRACAHV